MWEAGRVRAGFGVQCVHPKMSCQLIFFLHTNVGGGRLNWLSSHSLHFYKLSVSVSLHVSALFISADRILSVYIPPLPLCSWSSGFPPLIFQT